jgi:hypothetical protein
VLWRSRVYVEKAENPTNRRSKPVHNDDMPDNLDKYVPEFDEAGLRKRLAHCTKEELRDMLMRSYKEKRIIAKLFDELSAKMNSIHLVP